MTSHDLATLADALTFALLTTVSGAIGWAVFRVAARRYGVRRTATTISVAAVATLAVGGLAMWPAARGGMEAITGSAIPQGSAPEPQRTTGPAMPAPELALESVSRNERSVGERTTRTEDEGSQDQGLNGEPADDQSGGSGGPGQPADPGTDPDPSPPQSPSPDPPATSPPTTPPSPSPSPDDDNDDGDDDSDDDDSEDDDDDRLGDLVNSLESVLPLP